MTSPEITTFLYALVALLVIVDPVGTAVVFAALTPHDTAAERASQARRACLLAAIVLGVFGLAGERLLEALGIGLPAMRIAGGALLFLTAAEMVTGTHALRGTDPERQEAARTDQDIAIFPLGIPLIAGPGAMTSMVVLHSRAAGDPRLIAAIEAAGTRHHPPDPRRPPRRPLPQPHHGRHRRQRRRPRTRRPARRAGGPDCARRHP